MKITDLMDRYLEEKANHCSPATIIIMKARFAMFFNYISQNITTLESLSASEITAFQLWAESRQHTPRTLYMTLYEPKRFLKYLHESAYILQDLSSVIQLPKLKTPNVPRMRRDQALERIAKLESAPDYLARDQAIAILLLIEHIPRQQLRELSLLDLNLEEHQVRIKHTRTFVQLKPETVKYLRAYLRTRPQLRPSNDWLFISRNGARIKEASLKILIRRFKLCKPVQQ